MKVAITGVSGYLGRLIVERLGQEPDVDEIVGFDLASPQFNAPKLQFTKADVRFADFEKLFEGCAVLFHLAFVVRPPSNRDLPAIDQINVEGSKRVFDAAIVAGIRKIVYSSSTSAYGAHPDNPIGMTEDHPLRFNRNWYYSRAKGLVESYLDEVETQHPQIAIIRLRACAFVGPNMGNELSAMFVLPKLVTYNQTLQANYCWDQDVVDAFLLALRYDDSDTFNIAGDGGLTHDQIGKLLDKPVRNMNHSLSVIVARVLCLLRLIRNSEYQWLSVGFSGSMVVSNEKAKQVLGWKPRYDSASAIVETARQRGQLSSINEH